MRVVAILATFDVAHPRVASHALVAAVQVSAARDATSRAPVDDALLADLRAAPFAPSAAVAAGFEIAHGAACIAVVADIRLAARAGD